MSNPICSCCAEVRADDRRRHFAERCPWCQARLIQLIQRVLVVDQDQKRRRCQAVIADVVEWGLDEKEVRRLAKLPELALQPASEIQKKGKR